MRDSIKKSIQRVTRLGFDWAAGEYVEYYSPGDVKYPLLTLRRVNEKRYTDGLILDEAGIRDVEEATLWFHIGYLRAQGINQFDAAGYFIIRGERWDFKEGEPIANTTGPAADLHEVIKVFLRKSTELNSSIDGEEFRFGC